MSCIFISCMLLIGLSTCSIASVLLSLTETFDAENTANVTKLPPEVRQAVYQLLIWSALKVKSSGGAESRYCPAKLGDTSCVFDQEITSSSS